MKPNIVLNCLCADLEIWAFSTSLIFDFCFEIGYTIRDLEKYNCNHLEIFLVNHQNDTKNHIIRIVNKCRFEIASTIFSKVFYFMFYFEIILLQKVKNHFFLNVSEHKLKIFKH